jgi:hypothetical protein
MKVTRIFIFAIFALVLSAIAIYAAAGTVPAGFEKLKALEGNWVGTNEHAKSSTISYKLTSNGSAVMETLTSPESGDMVTMYHVNNGKIMMTHYCALNNQPRMQAEDASNPNQISFNYVDGTNMPDANATHMHKLVITFKDSDHFSEEWTLLDKGKEQAMVFEFERVK